MSNLEDFKKVVNKSKLPVVVLVSASWCNPCKIIKPIFLDKSKTEKSKGTFIIVDADESSDICMEYKITSIPTVLIIKDGKVQETYTGSNKDQFEKLLDKHL